MGFRIKNAIKKNVQGEKTGCQAQYSAMCRILSGFPEAENWRKQIHHRLSMKI